jgi:methylenetetrahydrofolate reductase (NADH)
VARAMKKVRAGARFFQLQLCFEPMLLERFLAAAVAQGLAAEAALLPSICLVRAPAALRYIDEHVPGISVPHEAIERIETAAEPEEACFQYGLSLAAHALAQAGVAGLHLISFRREAGIARLCRELGIPTRAERESSGYRTPVAV